MDACVVAARRVVFAPEDPDELTRLAFAEVEIAHVLPRSPFQSVLAIILAEARLGATRRSSSSASWLRGGDGCEMTFRVASSMDAVVRSWSIEPVLRVTD